MKEVRQTIVFEHNGKKTRVNCPYRPYKFKRVEPVEDRPSIFDENADKFDIGFAMLSDDFED